MSYAYNTLNGQLDLTVNFANDTLHLLLTGGTLTGLLTLAAQKVGRTAVADQAYSVLSSDYLVAYSSITATRVVTLVAAATAGSGSIVIIKDESGSVTPAIKITVDGSGAETIDGAASADITNAYGVLRLYSNGSNWLTW